MTNDIRIKRRASGATGAPASLENAELAYNEVDDTLYYGKGTGGAEGKATTVEAIGGKGAVVMLTGTQTVSGTKTFSSSPVVPAPTNNTDAATKKYVDDAAAAGTTAGNGLQKSGSEISVKTVSSSRIAVGASGVDLATSGVTADTYKSVSVDAYGRVTGGTNPTTLSGYGITDAVNTSDLGANNGVATLDSAGKVPTSQLPSYVDDVLEYNDLASFPATGETAKIYVAKDTGKIYRWSGSAYIEISSAGTADQATKLATARTVALTGDVTYTSEAFDGTANVTGTATLANSGVTAGTYGNVATTVQPFTVDSKGRITATGSPVTIAPAFSSLTSTPTTLAGYGITDALSTSSAIDGGTF